jgi:probable addiction module antidote protein
MVHRTLDAAIIASAPELARRADWVGSHAARVGRSYRWPFFWYPMAKGGHEVPDLTPVMSRINAALDTSDISSICETIGRAVMLHNVSEIARKAGLERTSLYRAFGNSHPNFTTVLNVLAAMGLQLNVVKSNNKRERQRPVCPEGRLDLTACLHSDVDWRAT